MFSPFIQSLERRAYDHLMATYLLLGEKLLHHRHDLSFGVPLQSDVGSVHTICELGANKPRMSIAIGQCAKHSRVDSAVDVKCSSLESESPASVMRLPTEPGVCDDAFRRNPAEDHNRHLRPSSPRRRTGPWTPNPDSGLISSLRTPAIDPVPNTRIPSYSDSNNPITCFYPPHPPILPHSIATDSPVNNHETCLFSSIPHTTEDRSPVCLTSPMDSSVFSANTANNTFASLHSDLMRTSRPTVILDPQPGSSNSLQPAMLTDRVNVSDVQVRMFTDDSSTLLRWIKGRFLVIIFSWSFQLISPEGILVLMHRLVVSGFRVAYLERFWLDLAFHLAELTQYSKLDLSQTQLRVLLNCFGVF